MTGNEPVHTGPVPDDPRRTEEALGRLQPTGGPFLVRCYVVYRGGGGGVGRMSKGRLEAFSDGVLAIIITIMVLELRAPREPDLAALGPLVPGLLSYVLSFVFVGIYWNNHHHLLQAVRHVNGRSLWANLHLLFWLSLIPFVTSWMGQTCFGAWPVAAYGVVMLLAGLAYYILSRVLVAQQGKESALAAAVGRDRKGKVSLLVYASAIPVAFAEPRVACGLYALVAVLWLVPDRRIETALAERVS
jgi:uncharacterized membrane protein